VTVAVAVKVFDGIVLATDSASTMALAQGGAQVWNNANKIFQLHRRYPVAAMTWGLGNVGSASIATLAKDLRRRLMGRDPAYPDWQMDDAYTVEGVANRLVDMIYDELYQPEFAGEAMPPTLGMFVAGYCPDGQHAEAWLIEMVDSATRPSPVLAIGQGQAGWVSYAQPEATMRLFTGFDPDLEQQLQAVLPATEMAKVTPILKGLHRTAVVAPMPFADAIAFARFLVDVTVGYSRATLGPDTVGGPVEVAGISRHEGFKWISRKHYYDPALNPEEPRHDH
jgi:hypothetical protein